MAVDCMSARAISLNPLKTARTYHAESFDRASWEAESLTELKVGFQFCDEGRTFHVRGR